MKNLWEIWPGALAPDYCDYINNVCMSLPAQDATVGFDPLAPAQPTKRTSTIRWLDVLNAHAPIAETIMRFVRRSNRTNFGFNITTMNEIQFTQYFGTDNGHYDWHHDVFWESPMPFDRKLSVSIQLTDPSEYEGGEFEFFGCASPGEEWKKRGSVLIFPSFFHHRVKPVTSGERRSLVSWIEGPKFR